MNRGRVQKKKDEREKELESHDNDVHKRGVYVVIDTYTYGYIHRIYICVRDLDHIYLRWRIVWTDVLNGISDLDNISNNRLEAYR